MHISKVYTFIWSIYL